MIKTFEDLYNILYIGQYASTNIIVKQYPYDCAAIQYDSITDKKEITPSIRMMESVLAKLSNIKTDNKTVYKIIYVDGEDDGKVVYVSFHDNYSYIGTEININTEWYENMLKGEITAFLLKFKYNHDLTARETRNLLHKVLKQPRFNQ